MILISYLIKRRLKKLIKLKKK